MRFLVIIISIFLITCKPHLKEGQISHLAALGINGDVTKLEIKGFTTLFQNGKFNKNKIVDRKDVLAGIQKIPRDIIEVNFDDLGNIIQIKSYLIDGTAFKTKKFNYNSNSELESTEFTYMNAQDTSLTSNYEYKDNKLTKIRTVINVVKTKKQIPLNEVKFEYNDKGFLFKKTITDDKRFQTMPITFEFKNNGEGVLTAINLFGNSEVAENNIKVDAICTQLYTILASHDTHRSNSFDGEEHDFRYLAPNHKTYEVDKFGNWVKQLTIESDWDGMPFLIERIITYKQE